MQLIRILNKSFGEKIYQWNDDQQGQNNKESLGNQNRTIKYLV